MILAGDIGGTKTTLALVDGDHAVRDGTVHSADAASLEEIIRAFLAAGPPGEAKPTAAAFGVAGPVVGGSAKITNLPWVIATKALQALLGGIPVALLNDLQATSLGMLVIPAEKFAVLQQGTPTADGAIAVIAPGTGLGEATLVSVSGQYRALPSEGGHADFAPGTDEEIELLHFLRKQHGQHVSYERVLSGAGLGDVYSFARAKSGVPEPKKFTAQMAAGDRNAVISETALAHGDAVCEHALDLFVAILGAEAGNLALRALATGGVVLGGGIPPKILPALQGPTFLARFTQKGRFTDWTCGLSVRVCLEPRAALYGAAHFAATLTKDTP